MENTKVVHPEASLLTVGSKEIVTKPTPNNPLDNFPEDFWSVDNKTANAYSALFWGNVNKNDADAFSLACIALNTRFCPTMAFFLLAQAYHAGDGVDKNETLAKDLIVDAYKGYASQPSSDPGANLVIFKNNLLGKFYADPNNPEQNLDEASRYFKIAANLGHTDSLYLLAEAYSQQPAGSVAEKSFLGLVKTTNQEKANEYYIQAANKGHAGAAYRLLHQLHNRKDSMTPLNFAKEVGKFFAFYPLAMKEPLLTPEEKTTWSACLFEIAENANPKKSDYHHFVVCYEAAANLRHPGAVQKCLDDAKKFNDQDAILYYQNIATELDPSSYRDEPH